MPPPKYRKNESLFVKLHDGYIWPGKVMFAYQSISTGAAEYIIKLYCRNTMVEIDEEERLCRVIKDKETVPKYQYNEFLDALHEMYQDQGVYFLMPDFTLDALRLPSHVEVLFHRYDANTDSQHNLIMSPRQIIEWIMRKLRNIKQLFCQFFDNSLSTKRAD